MDAASEAYAFFYTVLSACEGRGTVVAKNGSRFICHLPSIAPRAYLHTLYYPCSEDMLAEISEVFGFSLPESYATFMRLQNGARVFSGSISISGLVRNFNRSGDLEDLNPISLSHDCNTFRIVSKTAWSEGWRPIGSLVAKNLHEVMLHSSGSVKLRSATGREKVYVSFAAFLAGVLAAWEGHFTCEGYASGDYALLEATVEGLCSVQN